MAKSLFRKAEKRYQGLKICVAGKDGTGKSLYCLSYPELAIVDCEEKLGVYESTEKGKNIVGIIDSLEYQDLLGAYQEIVKNKSCQTFATDSITYMCSQMQVASMELEEQRAIRKGGDPADVNVSIKGYGKQRLNISRLRGWKCQASASGITIIDTAHIKDIMQKVGTENIKVGEQPDIPKNSRHEYDVILKFYKDKDLATGKVQYKALVEKDTTGTFEVGDIIDNPSYENTYKNYIEGVKSLKTINGKFGDSIDNNMKDMDSESDTFDSVRDEFITIYKSSDTEQKEKIKEVLKENDCAKYNDIANFDKLKVVLEIIKSW